MFRQSWSVCLLLGLAGGALSGSLAGAGEAAPLHSAAEIISRNVTARGGLAAWRAVQTMTLSGKLGAGGNQRPSLPLQPGQRLPKEALAARPVEEVQLPFVMELKRPRKMRFELVFNGETAVQVYDGANGWKLRPFLNRKEVESYTADESKIASAQADLDGALIDYAAKGTRADFDGTEKVDGRDNYRLKLTLQGGQVVQVWIDAETFLETKIEGQPRRLDGVSHPVEIYFHDYRPVDGLQIAFVLDTKVLPATQANKLGLKDPPVPAERTLIDRVVINPKLDDTLFTKPAVQVASR